MTPIEKLTIKSAAAAADSAAAALQDVGSIYNLLSANLPNLSMRDRRDLQNEATQRLRRALELKDSAKKLRAMVAGKQ